MSEVSRKGLDFCIALSWAQQGSKIRREGSREYYEVCSDRGTSWFQKVNIDTGNFGEFKGFSTFEMLETCDWETISDEELEEASRIRQEKRKAEKADAGSIHYGNRRTSV